MMVTPKNLKTKKMTTKFDEFMRQIDSIDQAHFGESLTINYLSGDSQPVTGIVSDEEIYLDALETTGFIVSVPLSQWQGPYPRRDRDTVTRDSTGVEYKVYKARPKGSDLIISLIG